MCEGGSVDQFESTAEMVGHRFDHRTTTAQGEGLSASTAAARGLEAGIE